ncbi:MAG: hypothetical protein IJ720_02470 [Clostridia bacterium]|nr:hypothetical protein [Clostridia bacterium]MBR1704210.1 hypothetical protein [Clostridia bacterium]
METPFELTQSGAKHLQDGDVHQALKDLVVANDKMSKLVDQDPSTENLNFYGITCLNLASVYQMIQDFESFRECARTGTNILERVLKERVSLETLFYLASVYLQLGQVDELEEKYESAEEYYKKAIERQVQVTEQELDAEASQYAKQTLSQEFLILTGLYQKMEDETKYLESLEHTVDLKMAIAEEFGHPYDWADAAMGEETLAGVIAAKAPDRAEHLFGDAVAILEKQVEAEEDIADVLIQVYRDFSVFLQQRDRQQEALEYFAKAESLAATRPAASDAEVGSIIEDAFLSEDMPLQEADLTRAQLFPEDDE